MQRFNPNNAMDKSDIDIAALAAGSAHTAGKGGVYISFQWEMVSLETVDPMKNGKRERRLKVVKTPVGDPSTTSCSLITPEIAGKRWPAEWEYFTKYGDMPETGTPLTELPGIAQSQIQIMQINGLRSIEDVLQIAPEIINKIGLEGRQVRTIAEMWDKRRTEAGEMPDFAALKAAQDSALEAEREKTSRLEGELAAMRAQIAGMQANMSQAGGAAAQTGDVAAMMGNDPLGIDRGAEVGDSMPNPLAEGDGLYED